MLPQNKFTETNAVLKNNQWLFQFFKASIIFKDCDLKKKFSSFNVENFDSDARFESSLKLYPEKPSSWAILAMFQPILVFILA